MNGHLEVIGHSHESKAYCLETVWRRLVGLTLFIISLTVLRNNRNIQIMFINMDDVRNTSAIICSESLSKEDTSYGLNYLDICSSIPIVTSLHFNFVYTYGGSQNKNRYFRRV